MAKRDEINGNDDVTDAAAFDDPFAEQPADGALFGGGDLGGTAGDLGAMMDTMVAGSAGGDEDDDIDLTGLDLSKVGDGRLAPDNTWLGLRILETKGGKSAKGNRKVDVKMRVVAPQEFAGGVVYDTLTLTEEAMWKLKSMAAACGQLDEQGVVQGSTRNFVDKEVMAQVIVDEYNGRKKNKVKGGYEVYDESKLGG